MVSSDEGKRAAFDVHPQLHGGGYSSQPLPSLKREPHALRHLLVPTAVDCNGHPPWTSTKALPPFRLHGRWPRLW